MINLEDYSVLIRVLERDVKDADQVTAYNIARELSAIHLKYAFDVPQKGVEERLTSLVGYIKKTIPKQSDTLVEVLELIIEDIKNGA